MMAFGAKIKLSVNTSGASAFRSEIQKYVNTATASNPIKLKNFSVSITKEQQRKIIRDIQAYLLSDNNALTLKIGKIDATGAVNKLRQQLQTMLSGLSITGLKEFLGETNIDKITEDTDNAKRAASQWAAQMRVVDDISKRLGSTYKTALSGSNMLGDSSQLAEITTAYTAWQTKVEALRETQTAMSTEELQNLQNEGIEIQRLISLLQERQAATTRAANEAERAEKQAEINARKELQLAQQQVSLKSQVQRYILSNSKAYKSYGAELDGIMQMLQSEARLTDEELKQIRRRFIEIQSSAKAAGKTGNTFFDTLKKGWEKFGGWSIVTRTMVAAWRVVVNMFTAVKELDAAMTELKKVTDLSEQSYQKYLATAQKLSVTVGATLADTVNATADFARLGYTVSEATSLAEAALVYKNVGDGIDDISMATESLISTIKAFGIEAENALSIVDKFNEVGNRFAISSEGIGTALQKSASALAAANNSLEESIALVTGMNAVIQNPEVVGTALKTVSMYLRAAKTEAEEAGEATDGMANSVSELRAELLTLTNNKVDIMLDDKSFKSTYQIMKELSEVWNELSDIDAANILELIGGKRNATAITSLLTNFEDAEKSLTTASAAAGSAMAENEKFLDSIAGKLSILESKFETFSTNLIDSGAIKFVVDLGSGLLTLLDLLNQIYLLLPLLGASATLVLTAVQSQKVSAVTTQIVLQKQAILDQKVATESLAVSLSGLSAKEQQHLIVQLQRKVAAGELTAEQYQQIVATLGLSSAEKGLVATDGTLIAANKGVAASFKSLMASVPIWGWIALGISLVLEFATVIGDLVGNIETSAEKIVRLDKEFEEISETIKGIASDYSELKKNTDDIIPRFVELAKGVNEFGEQVSLTDEEYEEFLSLNNQIAEMFPELDLGLDSNGNHILALSYSVDTLTESLQALVEAERMTANEKIADNMGDALKNIKSADKAYDKEIKALKDRKSNYQEALSEINRMHSEQDKYKEAYGDHWEEQYQLDTSWYVTQMQQAWGTIGNEADAEAWRKMVDKYEIDEKSLEVDWYEVINSDEFTNAMAGLDREINAAEEKQKNRWKKLNPIMGSWLQTTDDYNAASDDVQQLMSKIIGNIDYSSIGITKEKKLQEHITSQFIEPIANAAPEVQNAMVGLFDIKSAFDSGSLTVGEYGITDYILGDLQKAGISDTILSTLKDTLSLDEFNNQLNNVKANINGTDEEVLKFVNDLTYNEFNLVYSVLQKDGSMSIEELQEKVKQLRYAQAAMVEPLNMDDFVEGLNETASAVDKVTSAMAKLQEGTALGKKEIMDLVSQYPKLLQQANLFADGSVEAQKNALNAILDMQEQEYDAQIDAKIAELKATEQVLNNQLELEEQKANLVQEIKNMESNGKITQETDFINKLTELNDLQGQNYVSFKEGELQVNEEALNDQLQQGSDFANEAAENIWQPYGETIVSSHTQGYSAAMTATNNYTTSLLQRIKNFISNLGSAIANAWNDMWSGNWQGISAYFSQAMSTGDASISGGVVSVNFGGDRTTINGQGVNEWISDQEKASAYRIAEIEKIKVDTINAIHNLESLKGLDLTTIYGSSGSGSSKKNKEIEEYTANIEKYYEALKRLEIAQRKVEDLEKELSHTDDPAAQIKIYDQLVDAYKEEANAEKDLIAKRTATINDNVKALRALGFEVEYNAKTNDFYIKNLEHLNELTATSKGKYETLEEATNELRKSTEELINTTEDLNNDNQASIDNIEDLTYEIQEAAEEILACIEKIYEAQIESYNKIIEKRKEAIQSAKDEYKYEEDVAEKVKEIAELQAKIDKLSLDNSRAAQAKRASLMEELKEKQKDLEETQSDHAYDAQVDELDKMAEKYEEEKSAELDILRESIGTVQDLGTTIDQRITNAWKNAKKAVEEYGQSVAGLNGGVITNIGTVPKYHSGGVVGGNETGKEEVLALLEAGEIVLNDKKQDTIYRIIDFHSKLAERLGVDLGQTVAPLSSLDTTPNFGGTEPRVVTATAQTVFSPEFNIEINHNGEMSDDEARRYGSEIADTAIAKLYNAFERKGISNHNGAKLKP